MLGGPFGVSTDFDHFSKLNIGEGILIAKMSCQPLSHRKHQKPSRPWCTNLRITSAFPNHANHRRQSCWTMFSTRHLQQDESYQPRPLPASEAGRSSRIGGQNFQHRRFQKRPSAGHSPCRGDERAPLFPPRGDRQQHSSHRRGMPAWSGGPINRRRPLRRNMSCMRGPPSWLQQK